MFESDDYDQELSQFELPDLQQSLNGEASIELSSPAFKTDLPAHQITAINCVQHALHSEKKITTQNFSTLVSANKSIVESPTTAKRTVNNIGSPITKKRILNNHFDRDIKRKFPGPAGILSGSLQEQTDENISHIEILSQDVDNSLQQVKYEILESALWCQLVNDVAKWDGGCLSSIANIKQQAIAGTLSRRKAGVITAFIESIDRSVTDPLVLLRDNSSAIKGTLHRDAWAVLSPYMVSEYSALILWKPTVLTTGSACKKHYLNITLDNIVGLYCSAPIKPISDEEKPLPTGYKREEYDTFIVVRMSEWPQHKKELPTNEKLRDISQDFFQGLDSSNFLDDDF